MIIKLLTLLFFLTQLVSFYNYNKHFVLEWIDSENFTKNKLIIKKDKTILIVSLSYIWITLTLMNTMSFGYNGIDIFFLLIVIILTIITLLFYHTKFKVFKPSHRINTFLERKKIVREPFQLKEFNDSELFDLYKNNYEKSFSSNFISFKNLFIDFKFNQEKLISIDIVQRNKRFSYDKIFNLMNDVTQYGILNLFEDDRVQLYNFIIQNFQRGDETIVLNNLKPALSKWLKNNG